MRRWMTGVTAVAMLMGCEAGEKPKPPEEGSPFQTIVADIFLPRCATPGCHRGENPSGKLDLSEGAAYAGLVGVHAHRRPERLLVDPGNPGGSYLVERLGTAGDTPAMPMGGKALAPEDVERIREWIRGGAKP